MGYTIMSVFSNCAFLIIPGIKRYMDEDKGLARVYYLFTLSGGALTFIESINDWSTFLGVTVIVATVIVNAMDVLGLILDKKRKFIWLDDGNNHEATTVSAHATAKDKHGEVPVIYLHKGAGGITLPHGRYKVVIHPPEETDNVKKDHVPL